MKIFRIVSIILIISVLFSLFSVLSYAQYREYSWFCKRCGNKQPPITEEEKMLAEYSAYSIDRSLTDESKDKVIYLTFDLGYENGNTAKILDALKREGIHCAFFVLDNILLKNIDLVNKMIDEGHLICNHTKNHKNLSNSTPDEIEKNLSDLEKLYEQKTGHTLAKYFRFPEGKYSKEALSVVHSLGYKTIFWSFAYADWDNTRQMSPKAAMRKILDNTHNGAIMLFHPTSRVNAEIFPDLILEWKRMGYRFGTLDEL